MKFIKKYVSPILVFALLVNLFPAVALASDDASTSGIIYENSTTEILLDNVDIEKYTSYSLNISDFTSLDDVKSETNITDEILSRCSPATETYIDGVLYTDYTSDTLHEYIKNCKEVTSISHDNEFINIMYNTINHETVAISYYQNKLTEILIYYEDTDTLLFLSEDKSVLYENFRKGSHYEISDELLNEIYYLVEHDKLDELHSIEGLSITEDETGHLYIEPAMGTISPLSAGYENDALAGLEAAWPTFTNSTVSAYSKYCSALGKNVTIKVSDTRNTYVLKTANWAEFVIGTTLSAISIYLGLGTGITVIAKILDALNIATTIINGYKVINENLDLCVSAKYSYSGIRYGQAYDSPLQAYVVVLQYDDIGEFTGGYDNKGDFRWIESVRASGFNKDKDTLANKTIQFYNADLVLHAFTSYFPYY